MWGTVVSPPPGLDAQRTAPCFFPLHVAILLWVAVTCCQKWGSDLKNIGGALSCRGQAPSRGFNFLGEFNTEAGLPTRCSVAAACPTLQFRAWLALLSMAHSKPVQPSLPAGLLSPLLPFNQGFNKGAPQPLFLFLLDFPVTSVTGQSW